MRDAPGSVAGRLRGKVAKIPRLGHGRIGNAPDQCRRGKIPADEHDTVRQHDKYQPVQRREIRKAADEARERRAKADQLAGDIQARLSHIEADVRAIHERAEQEGERQKRDLIASAEAEAQKILAAARNEVDNRLKTARHELTEYAGQLAAERAEAILRETITDADRQKLFAESLREVGEARS